MFLFPRGFLIYVLVIKFVHLIEFLLLSIAMCNLFQLDTADFTAQHRVGSPINHININNIIDEPGTYRFTHDCSTTELRSHFLVFCSAAYVNMTMRNTMKKWISRIRTWDLSIHTRLLYH